MMFQSIALTEFVSNARERNRYSISLPLVFAVGIYSIIITHPSAVLRDPDTFWHIAVGRWIMDHSAVPDHGIFSATMADAPWIDQEWLAEVLMAWGYDHFGWAALAIGTALCEAVAIAIVLRVLLAVLPPVYAMFATVLAGVLSSPHLLARPYILTIPILVVWLIALVRARNQKRTPSPWFTLLIVLWANLHASFVFGLGIAALLAAEAVLLARDWYARLRATRDWGCFGALVLGAALVTPYGVSGLSAPFHLINMSALTYIGEWQGVNFSQSWSMTIMIWLLTVLFAALTLGWRFPPIRVVIVLLLLAMALKHLRYMELLGPVSTLLIAPSLALHLDRQRAPSSKIDHLMTELSRPANWRGNVIAGVVMLVVGTLGLRGGNAHPVEATFPAAAIAEVKAKHIEGPVFNSYTFGGSLIFSGIAPFIDGRTELYGDIFVKRYISAVQVTDNRLPELLSDNGIAWTILPAQTPAAVLMDHLPGWRCIYVDSAAAVHVKQSN